MIADTHNGTRWRDRIVLVADDAGKYSWTTSEYVTRYVRSKPAKLHIVVLRDTYSFKVGSHDFFGIDYQKTDEGQNCVSDLSLYPIERLLCELDFH
jgi:hypothetical protein